MAPIILTTILLKVDVTVNLADGITTLPVPVGNESLTRSEVTVL